MKKTKKPRFYLVKWEIELDAVSAKAAAREALLIQRDPESTATYFHVFEVDTDGNPLRDEEVRVDL